MTDNNITRGCSKHRMMYQLTRVLDMFAIDSEFRLTGCIPHKLDGLAGDRKVGEIRAYYFQKYARRTHFPITRNATMCAITDCIIKTYTVRTRLRALKNE